MLVCWQLNHARYLIDKVALAEQGLAKQGRGGFDPAWQEMLNHSTMKVNEAEQERIASESYHKLASHRYQEADQYVKFLQKDLKRNIAKSRSYFETKAKFNQVGTATLPSPWPSMYKRVSWFVLDSILRGFFFCSHQFASPSVCRDADSW